MSNFYSGGDDGSPGGGSARLDCSRSHGGGGASAAMGALVTMVDEREGEGKTMRIRCGEDHREGRWENKEDPVCSLESGSETA